MFFTILATCTKWILIHLSLAQSILLLIFQCHTVTHGTDLRRSPHVSYFDDLPPTAHVTWLQKYKDSFEKAILRVWMHVCMMCCALHFKMFPSQL